MAKKSPLSTMLDKFAKTVSDNVCARLEERKKPSTCDMQYLYDAISDVALSPEEIKYMEKEAEKGILDRILEKLTVRLIMGTAHITDTNSLICRHGSISTYETIRQEFKKHKKTKVETDYLTMEKHKNTEE